MDAMYAEKISKAVLLYVFRITFPTSPLSSLAQTAEKSSELIFPFTLPCDSPSVHRVAAADLHLARHGTR